MIINNGAQEALNGLRNEIACDFCALAVWSGESRVLKWKLASGNENGKFAGIAEREQSGLSQTVVKVGRAMSLQLADLLASRRIHEYPILLAEGLRSAYAVPIFADRKVIGVLLAGDRKRRIYRADERNSVLSSAEELAEHLEDRPEQSTKP